MTPLQPLAPLPALVSAALRTVQSWTRAYAGHVMALLEGGGR